MYRRILFAAPMCCLVGFCIYLATIPTACVMSGLVCVKYIKPPTKLLKRVASAAPVPSIATNFSFTFIGTVALVGESGSGKSTVIALIERFYDPDSGLIFIDGCDLKSFKLNWLRRQLGLVGQEPVLFNESIAANIAYGKEGVVTQEEIVVAATAANAHGFISALADGYNTNVGERHQMSGGQKQRIAIVRAILKDPRILLLDEATSALDAESRRSCKQQEALDYVMVDRTTVVVAHRLSTISGAHKIEVVKDGVIAEKGRHEDLIRIPDGAYASLVAFRVVGEVV
ncbi:hypothetical protein LUZ63_008584 [Rhynchospora breviuscula]|uniref:ABC transporter domain-containing protein n=1 Tax=Rhynchospora breviuscula TaxID=2022672 RepID=A0A9Q0CUP8_9POAL|nr:hypothetical protein LUZ63_008584 [Rhynchospora breviuscula]